MATVTIDGIEHDTESMSDQARAQLDSLTVCERKLGELRAEMAMVETAKRAYLAQLKVELQTEHH